MRKLIEKLGGGKNLKVCYEAGPTGYALYWQLTKLGVDCEVIAPSLIPKKAGDKVKTDRRDAEKLAQSYQSGDLTPVWVPTPEHEALRDLVRQRAAAKADESRAKHRLVKHLLRRGLREPDESGAWTHPQLRARTFRTFTYARATVLKSWRNWRCGKAGLLTAAQVAGHRPVRCKTLRPRFAPGCRQLRRQVDRRAEVHLVRGLAGERRMWHLGVVLLDEERHESAETLYRVEGVEVKPLVFQRTPERLDHRVGIGNIDLCEDALQARR